MQRNIKLFYSLTDFSNKIFSRNCESQRRWLLLGFDIYILVCEYHDDVAEPNNDSLESKEVWYDNTNGVYYRAV